MTNASPLNSDNIVLPHGREKYAAQWIENFERWLEKIIGQRVSIIADGKEHCAGGRIYYALDLAGKHPCGYVCGDISSGPREIWWPSYRNADYQIDAGQLIAGNGGPFIERPLSLRDEIFFTGFQLEFARNVVPASMESIRPTRLARLRTDGTEIAEIEIGIRCPHGTATFLIPIYSRALPPGCGRLRPGSRVALHLARFGPETAQLLGILPDQQIVEVRP